MNWNEMTYDEQRALLGLPDVRLHVAWARIRLQMLGITQAYTRVFEAIHPAIRAIEQVQQDYALAKGK